MGHEPSQVTYVNRDWLGRVRSVVTVSESEFSDHDRHAILASRRLDARPRGAHGRLLSEATDPTNEYRYQVELPFTDFAQAALNKAQRKYRDAFGEEADMESLLWTVDHPDD